MSNQKSFRDHLDILQEEGLLLRIRAEVDPVFEAAALIKQASKNNKAIYFERLKGHDRPVVANVAGSRNMLSLALGMDESSFLPDFVSKSMNKYETRLVKKGPVQDVVEESSSFAKLPVLTYFEKDAGPYITAGTVIAKDPETGFRNSSYNRIMLKSSDLAGIRMMPPQHLGLIQLKAERKEKNLEVAIVIGNHPAEMIASASSLPFGEDHLNFASSLRGERLETVKCQSVDIEVPAYSELVIEGEIRANIRELEGPFGEFMDYYVPEGKNHVLKVKKITHRTDYLFQAMLCGSAEDLGILALSRESLVYKSLKAAGYDVVDVSLMPFIFNGAVSIRKKFEGEPKNAMLCAFGAYSWLKYCVVVDDDVNVQDLSDVWWAMATRSQADKSVFTIPEALGFPRKDKWHMHRGKVGIDATVPLELKPEFERKQIPGQDKVSLSKYS